jgi:hypothetical protein
MKFLTIFALVIGTLATASLFAREAINHMQTQDNESSYEQQQLDKNAKLAKACEAGQTGVVLFHNGKSCAK